ncbi:MAG: CheB methylesterase domain-containing protein [Planctomycetota bacterium]
MVHGAERARIAVAASDHDAEMLREWLQAAGFDAVPIGVQGHSCVVGARATLVGWPVGVDLAALPKPVVLLYEPGRDPGVAARLAAEVLQWPDRSDVKSLLAWSAQLGTLLHRLVARTSTQVRAVVPAPLPLPAVLEHDADGERAPPALIAIGISTGGPTSLRVLFDGLRGHRLPPIVVVQHIPAGFVADLVHRLQEQCGYAFRVAEHGMPLEPGVAYMSPGDHHLRITAQPSLRCSWSDDPPFRGHRPSVEVLFDSCALLDETGIAVMMTGMGQDGANAMLRLRQRGWATVGQDQETCTIYGMPQAAKQVGAVERELPLQQIATWLIARSRRRARA